MLRASRDPDPAEIRRLVEVVLCTTAPGPARALLASWPAARGVCGELREECLVEAAGYFTGSRWAAALALEQALRQFKATSWPRLENRPTAAVEAQGLTRVLLRLVTLGQRAASADRLHRSLSANSANSTETLAWR